MDSDDLWLPHKLEIQIKFSEQHPDLDFIYGDAYSFRDETILTKSMFSERPPYKGRVLKKLLVENFIPVATVMVLKKSFEKSGFFKEGMQYCTDYEMWIRLAKFSKFGYVNEVVAGYRIHDKNVSSNMKKCMRLISIF